MVTRYDTVPTRENTDSRLRNFWEQVEFRFFLKKFLFFKFSFFLNFNCFSIFFCSFVVWATLIGIDFENFWKKFFFFEKTHFQFVFSMVPTDHGPDRTWSQGPHGRSCVYVSHELVFYFFSFIFLFFFLFFTPKNRRSLSLLRCGTDKKRTKENRKTIKIKEKRKFEKQKFLQKISKLDLFSKMSKSSVICILSGWDSIISGDHGILVPNFP